MKSSKNHVIVVFASKEFGSITRQQEAILAKQQAESARSAP